MHMMSDAVLVVAISVTGLVMGTLGIVAIVHRVILAAKAGPGGAQLETAPPPGKD